MASNILNASLRHESGKGAAKQLRRNGRIPAVIYGHGEETRSLAVDAHEVGVLFAHISVDNTVISVDIDGESGGAVQALIRDVQTHPVRNEVLHLDFYQIHADEKVDVDVPIRLVGTAEGVKTGGIMEHIVHELEIRCLPASIPEVIEVDVTALDTGDSIHLRDITLPEGVTTDLDPDRTICTVVAPTVEEVEEEEPEEEALLGLEGELEPELIGEEVEEGAERPEAEEAEEEEES